MIKKLTKVEIELISTISRKEDIAYSYSIKGGALSKFRDYQVVQGWDAAELCQIIQRSIVLLDEGGVVFGYFVNNVIKGVASLSPHFLDDPEDHLLMDIMYVDTGSRGLGIGTKLFELILKEATLRGAVGIYISATPTLATVDFYLSQSSALVAQPNVILFNKEPLDIHLQCSTSV